MKRIAIMQPAYLPWMGFFQLIESVDAFVFLDTVQFEKQYWQSRNRICDKSGNILWLTVPVQKHPLDTAIRDIRISADERWKKKHLATIQQILGKAPHAGEILPLLEDALSGAVAGLSELNIRMIRNISALLGQQTEFHLASELQASGKRTELLREICIELGADRYLSPARAREYLEGDMPILSGAGITVEYQSWEHPVYFQATREFVSHLSIIDALANLGSRQVRLCLQSSVPASR